MPNNPVQVILNTRDYFGACEEFPTAACQKCPPYSVVQDRRS